MKRKTNVSIAAFVRLPILPNFLISSARVYDIADVSDADLKKIGRKWTTALIRHAKSRRERR